MKAAVLETKGLNLHFGGVVAASEISVAVAEGEVVGVIGANGAGKTTFVNMVTGYLKPDSGTIHYLGQDVTSLTPREITRIGIRRSFQIPQVFAEMSCLDNLLAALALAPSASRSFWRPLKRAGTVDAGLRILNRFGIGDSADQVASMLPQGVRKILDIAMATVEEPELVLLDEPTSGVSADEKFPVMDTLMGALRDQGATVMFVEHDMEVVERYAGRVLAFYNGKVIADAPVQEALSDGEVRRYVVGKELHRAHAEDGGGQC